MKGSWLTFFCLLLLCAGARADEDPVVLYEWYKPYGLKPWVMPVEGYEAKVAKLKPGMRVTLAVPRKPGQPETEFPTKTFTIARILTGAMLPSGEPALGNTSFVFVDEHGKSQRIPKGSGPFETSRMTYRDYNVEYLAAWEELRRSELAPYLVQIDPEESVPGVHIQGETLDVETTCEEYLRNFEKYEHRPEMLADLENFARATEAYAKLGDFRPAQLVWVRNKGWRLVDLAQGNIHVPSLREPATVFDFDPLNKIGNSGFPPDSHHVKERLVAAVADERDRIAHHRPSGIHPLHPATQTVHRTPGIWESLCIAFPKLAHLRHRH